MAFEARSYSPSIGFSAPLGLERAATQDRLGSFLELPELPMRNNRNGMESLVKPIRRDVHRATQNPVAGQRELRERSEGFGGYFACCVVTLDNTTKAREV